MLLKLHIQLSLSAEQQSITNSHLSDSTNEWTTEFAANAISSCIARCWHNVKLQWASPNNGNYRVMTHNLSYVKYAGLDIKFMSSSLSENYLWISQLLKFNYGLRWLHNATFRYIREVHGIFHPTFHYGLRVGEDLSLMKDCVAPSLPDSRDNIRFILIVNIEIIEFRINKLQLSYASQPRQYRLYQQYHSLSAR